MKINDIGKEKTQINDIGNKKTPKITCLWIFTIVLCFFLF